MTDAYERVTIRLVGVAATVGAILVGCGGGAVAPTAASNGPTSPATVPSASAVASAAAPTSTSSADAPVAIAPQVDALFVAVSELPYPMRLFPLNGVVLGVGETPLYENDELKGLPMGVIDGDRFLDKPQLRLMTFMSFVVGAVGSWPQGVDLLVTGTTGRTGIAEHYVMTADAGWNQRSATQGSYYAGFATVGPSTIAIEAPSMPFGQAPVFKTIRGPKLPRSFEGLDAACKKQLAADGVPPQYLPRNRLAASAFGGTAAGTLVAVGDASCGDDVLAEIWDPGSVTSHTLVLGKVGKTQADDALVVRGAGADDAWIFYRGVYHFDQNAIEPWPALPEPGVRAAAVGPNGELFVVTPSQTRWDQTQQKLEEIVPARLYRAKDHGWVEVPLPGPPSGLVGDGQTVWLVSGNTLFRTRRSASETSIAVKAAPPTKREAHKLLRNVRPAGPLCPNNLVVLYGFTKVTPEDYDFPATRKAIKGHLELGTTRFVVAKDGGQKFFSAIVPDVSAGRKLVALIEKEVAGSKPQLVCADPEIVREVRIDLRTGDVQK